MILGSQYNPLLCAALRSRGKLCFDSAGTLNHVDQHTGPRQTLLPAWGRRAGEPYPP